MRESNSHVGFDFLMLDAVGERIKKNYGFFNFYFILTIM